MTLVGVVTHRLRTTAQVLEFWASRIVLCGKFIDSIIFSLLDPPTLSQFIYSLCSQYVNIYSGSLKVLYPSNIIKNTLFFITQTYLKHHHTVVNDFDQDGTHLFLFTEHSKHCKYQTCAWVITIPLHSFIRGWVCTALSSTSLFSGQS